MISRVKFHFQEIHFSFQMQPISFIVSIFPDFKIGNTENKQINK